MAIFAVEYNYVTDRDEEMAQVRPTHRAFNGELAEQGKLIAAGQLPIESAVSGAHLRHFLVTVSYIVVFNCENSHSHILRGKL